jgi:hypothetical protein
MENIEATKVCTKCGEVKPITEFYRDKANKDGRRPSCKSCDSAIRKQRYAKNPEKELAGIRQYAAKHKDKISEYHKEYRKENIEKLISEGYTYRKGRKEIVSEGQKEQRRTNPEAYVWSAAKRRAKEFGLPFTIDKTDIIIPEVCPIFGLPLRINEGATGDDSISLDKIVPELGYVTGNIAVISRRANVMKSNGTSAEHRQIADWIEGKSSVCFTTRPADKSHASTLLTCARKRAKDNKLPFSITKEYMLIPNICPALGIPIERNKGKMQDSSPTLDKIIPELGYVPGNVAVISWRANRIKNVGTAAEHRQIADWIDTQLNRPDNGQTPEASD